MSSRGRGKDRIASGRRRFLGCVYASLAAAAIGLRARPARAAARSVVVVGAGYGGATAAKYIRMWSAGKIDVTVIEREAAFVSCPVSNLVIGGSRTLADITVPYDGLGKWGVRVVRDEALDIDPVARTVRLALGEALSYDRLILSPGMDFIYDGVPSLATAAAQDRSCTHGRPGRKRCALRAQIEAMPDGGVFAIPIPRAPLRCPPGPYERACQVAWYFRRAKPRAKVLVLDGNEDIQSKKALFLRAWEGGVQGNNPLPSEQLRCSTWTSRRERSRSIPTT